MRLKVIETAARMLGSVLVNLDLTGCWGDVSAGPGAAPRGALTLGRGRQGGRHFHLWGSGQQHDQEQPFPPGSARASLSWTMTRRLSSLGRGNGMWEPCLRPALPTLEGKSGDQHPRPEVLGFLNLIIG